MKNKFLINVIVPEIQETFNIYIPNNKKIGTVKTVVLSSIKELSSGYFVGSLENTIFIDRDTGAEYKNDVYVKDSGITNGTKIVII